jgi:hypothetical protein
MPDDYTNFGDEPAVDTLESGLVVGNPGQIFPVEFFVGLAWFITLKNLSAGDRNSIHFKFRSETADAYIGDQGLY